MQDWIDPTWPPAALLTFAFLVLVLAGAVCAGHRVALWPRLRPRPGRQRPVMDKTTCAVALALAGPIALFWSFLPLAPFQAGVLVLFGITLGALAGHDWRRGLLPLPETILVAGLGIGAVGLGLSDPLDAALGSVFGVTLFWVINLMWRRGRGQRALGGGDLHLMAGLGLWVGLSGLPFLLVGAALGGLGAAWVIGARGQIAFGPWLALAGWGVVLINILDIAPYIR